MKPILLTILILLSSCSKHSDHETVDDYPTVDEIGEGYARQIEDYSIEELMPDRCDRLTFKSLAASFIDAFDISGHEYQPGEWHRDIAPCYPDDSRSEVSFDNLIGVLHHAWTSNDRDMIERLADYGRENDWVFGEGPREYTFLPQVGVLTDMLLGQMNLTPKFSLQSTHNEHIIALSGWLKLRSVGYLESQDLLVLRNLKSNMLIRSIIARVTEGNQSEAIYYLSQYPEKWPLETGEQEWSGCPKWLYFFLIKAVVDGH
jgi:hypothetical protein